MPITTNVVSLKPEHGKEYSIQHYVIKCVSDLRQVDSFLMDYIWQEKVSEELPIYKLELEIFMGLI
jgi:predicted RNase H-like nuclease